MSFLGHVMLGIEGFELTPEDHLRLQHRQTGGVILFRRNFSSKSQLKKLVSDIRSIRDSELLVAVDHEGGRVQRFIHDGFTRLPSMRLLGEAWDQESPEFAVRMARQVARVLAYELRECGIDFSYTPVLDLAWGNSDIIGDRSFHRSPDVVACLSLSLLEGLRDVGMAACAKHFPGHGFVAEDSHTSVPRDSRPLLALEEDIAPYAKLINFGLEAIMPAHVIYPEVDSVYPAGFSSIWVGDVLRKKMGFDGAIVSDDLCMQGAMVLGDIRNRALQAVSAGCDLLLLCNDLLNAYDVLNALGDDLPDQQRLERLKLKSSLISSNEYIQARNDVQCFLDKQYVNHKILTEEYSSLPMVGEVN